MLPVSLDTEYAYCGDAYQLRFCGEIDAQSGLVNLLSYGSTFSAQLRRTSSSTTVFSFGVDQSNIDGSVDASAQATQLVLSLTGDQTRAMGPGQWRFDVQATGGTLSPLTLYSGTLELKADYTHA